jgi:uncharacterized protein (DUF433 family)
MENNLLNRITVDPNICHGKPTIRKTRYSVALILELLSSGMTEQEIISDYPNIESEDIKACLLFASKINDYKIDNLIIA